MEIILNDSIESSIKSIRSNNSKLSDNKRALIDKVIKAGEEEPKAKLESEDYISLGISGEWREAGSSAFSYQNKAVKDFIYRFSKCGILSDQVGMGKTIEAGMIISELAYRKELNSLLILVPNENMAEKWQKELARKFGIRNFYERFAIDKGKKNVQAMPETMPRVFAIKSLDDLYAVFYSAFDSCRKSKDDIPTLDDTVTSKSVKVISSILKEYKSTLIEKIHELASPYKFKFTNNNALKYQILMEVVRPVIVETVKAIHKELDLEDGISINDYFFDEDGEYYYIVDRALDIIKFKDNEDKYAERVFNALFNADVLKNSIYTQFDYIKRKRGIYLLENIGALKKALHESSINAIFKRIAREVKRLFAVLIVSKVVTEKDDPKYPLLKHRISVEYRDVLSKNPIENVEYKGYCVIDFLIDMSYETLIIDEAHDYINVSYKLPMPKTITRNENNRTLAGNEFSDKVKLPFDMAVFNDYFVFPLFDDYYFINKDSMYPKVSALANRAYRKIFMTATPIKSDMIDFYLLKLLTESKDSYALIRKALYNLDDSMISELVDIIIREGKPDYRKYALNFYTYEDIIIKYVFLFKEKFANHKDFISYMKKNDYNQVKLEAIYEAAINFIREERFFNEELFDEVCFNKSRDEFEDKYKKVDKNGKEKIIKSIGELVKDPEGVVTWKKMYQGMGIRSTRHQTYCLDDKHTSYISKSLGNKVSSYQNLPLWSKRNGIVYFIKRNDKIFDIVVGNMLMDRINKHKQHHLDVKEASLFSDHVTQKEVFDQFVEDVREEIEVEKDDTYSLFNKMVENPLIEEIKRENDEYDNNMDNLSQDDTTSIEAARVEHEKNLKAIRSAFIPKQHAYEIYNWINDQLSGEREEFYSKSVGEISYTNFKLHMLLQLITDEKVTEDNKIKGKVLLFSEKNEEIDNYDAILDWLRIESDYDLWLKNYKETLGPLFDNNTLKATKFKEDKDFEKDYFARFKHWPLCVYNRRHPQDAWSIGKDIKDLSKANTDNKNCIIVVEPNKYEEGVDLQTSDILINFDIKYCPLKMEQRIGRIDRVKLSAVEQPNLKIISFAPLNDLSGFIVEFLAFELELFSSWKGDTTGIVSMPIGRHENSATFEDIMISIDKVYKSLYDYDATNFYAYGKELLDKCEIFKENFASDSKEMEYFNGIKELFDISEAQKQDEIKYFAFLKKGEPIVQKLLANIQSTKDDVVLFNELGEIAESYSEKVGQSNIKEKDTTNDINVFIKQINLYYTKMISFLKALIEYNKEEQIEKYDGGVQITTTSKRKQKNNTDEMSTILAELEKAKKAFSNQKEKLENESYLNISKIQDITNPILNRYTKHIKDKLTPIIDLFEYFCSVVRNNADNMTKFVSQLTVEDFSKIISGGDENE